MTGKALGPGSILASKWVVLGLGVCVLFGLVWWPLGEQALLGLLAWLGERGWYRPFAFGLVYIVATVLLLPGGVFSITAGALFGVPIGTLIAALASTTGAALAFLLARHLAQERVARWVQGRPKLHIVYLAMGAGGWRMVALFRLFPPIPYSLQNYLYGLTTIGFCPYLLTSGLTMLPPTFLYVNIGHLAHGTVSGTHQHTLAGWLVLGSGFIGTGLAVVYITRLIRQRLHAPAMVPAPEP